MDQQHIQSNFEIESYIKNIDDTKIKNIDKTKFIICDMSDINCGDIIMSHTFTYSQKYLLDDSYSEYNMVKYGILIEKNETNYGDSKIIRFEKLSDGHINYTESHLYLDMGTRSGCVQIYKYVE